MDYRVIHTNHFGQVVTRHGDSRREGSTAREIFEFESLASAREHASRFVRRFPELECTITWDGGSERVADDEAQQQYIAEFCTVPRSQLLIDLAMTLLFGGSLVLNVVLLGYLLWR